MKSVQHDKIPQTTTGLLIRICILLLPSAVLLTQDYLLLVGLVASVFLAWFMFRDQKMTWHNLGLVYLAGKRSLWLVILTQGMYDTIAFALLYLGIQF